MLGYGLNFVYKKYTFFKVGTIFVWGFQYDIFSHFDDGKRFDIVFAYSPERI